MYAVQVSFQDPYRAQQQIFSYVAYILASLKRVDIIRVTLILSLVSFAQRDTTAWDAVDRVLSNSDDLGPNALQEVVISF